MDSWNLLGANGPDWTAFLISNYYQTLLQSPLLVIETLQQVQFQKRPDGSPAREEQTNGHVLPRLQGDFADSLNAVVSSAAGPLGLLKGDAN